MKQLEVVALSRLIVEPLLFPYGLRPRQVFLLSLLSSIASR